MLPNRVREHRRRAKWTLEKLAEKSGIDLSYLSRIERGDRTPTIDVLEKLGDALGVPAFQLMASSKRLVPVVGYVGAGAEVRPIDDHAPGAGLDEVEPPANAPDDVVCVIVRGDSQYPRFMDGERLFYVRDGRPPDELFGRECIVKLADGRMLVKTVRRGTDYGLFNLESWNAPPMLDQVVEWAAPVRWTERNW